jgi:hypothetical protein
MHLPWMVKQKTKSMTKELLALIGACIALLASILSLYTAYLNRTELEYQKKKLDLLADVASHVALSLTIEKPSGGDSIKTDRYNQMHGSMSGNLPEGYSLWVVAKDEKLFYLQHTPISYAKLMSHWSHTDINLPATGRWELHVCLADKAATSWANERVARGDKSGFKILPKGMITIKYVFVDRD